MKKLLSVILVFVICLTAMLGGCGKDDSKETAVNDNVEPASFAATSVVLAENGKSDYKIVVPQSPTGAESYAAEELQNFFYESTGATLEIINDSGLSHDNSKKYLSVGNTSLLKAQTDIVLDYKTMGENGPSIDRRDNTVYMAGAADTGTLYSVYKFLYYEIGFKAYAVDCVTYDYRQKVYLLDFNYHYVPSIDWCYGGEATSRVAYKLENFRMYETSSNGGSTSFYGNNYSGWCHTIPNFMPYTSYADYYGVDSQYCYTSWTPKQAGLATDETENILYETFAENLYNYYIAQQQPRFVMLGGADNESFCTCEGCTKEIEKYGKSGVYMRFLNKISETLEEVVLPRHNYTKDLTLVGLFYHSTCIPPFKMDVEGRLIKDENGNYIPLDDSVYADTEGQVQVGICFAAIAACNFHSFASDSCSKNVTHGEYLFAYRMLTDYLMFYTYGNLGNFTTLYDNYSAIVGYIKLCAEANVDEFFEEGPETYNKLVPVEALHKYIRSSFAWNADLDYKTVVSEFCEAYYGLGAESFEEYFYEYCHHYGYLCTVSGETHHSYFTEIGEKSYWPLQTINSLSAKLQTAMNEINASSLSDSEKEVYTERVYRDYALIKYQEYKHYSNTYSESERLALEELVNAAMEKYSFKDGRGW